MEVKWILQWAIFIIISFFLIRHMKGYYDESDRIDGKFLGQTSTSRRIVRAVLVGGLVGLLFILITLIYFVFM